MKKTVSLVLALLMAASFCVSLSACGGSESSAPVTESPSSYTPSATEKNDGLSVSDAVEMIEDNIYDLGGIAELSKLEKLDTVRDGESTYHYYYAYSNKVRIVIGEADGVVHFVEACTYLKDLNLDGSYSNSDLMSIAMGLVMQPIAVCHSSNDDAKLQKLINDNQQTVQDDSSLMYIYEDEGWHFELGGTESFSAMTARAVRMDSPILGLEDTPSSNNSNTPDETIYGKDKLSGHWVLDYALSRSNYEKVSPEEPYVFGLSFLEDGKVVLYRSDDVTYQGEVKFVQQVEGMDGYNFILDIGTLDVYVSKDHLGWASDTTMFYYKPYVE
ncbi:MAG: hypothetical protein IJ426_05460 [Clostridia bacterium]|nr:hypothetical protein [Clostridia bacterium]